MAEKLGNFTIENAKIMFRNFSGKASKFNAEGKRNFCVMLPLDMAEQLKEDGWNVKALRPREEDDEPLPYIQVSVSYGAIPPNIYMIKGKVKTLLDEDTVGSLDYADIKNVDIIIRPYQWEVNGMTGIKAYAKTMYVTIEEDCFADKYRFEDEMEIPF